MKIIREGFGPSSIFLGECQHCDCVFECPKKELLIKTKETNPLLRYVMFCPCCAKEVGMSPKKVREYNES